MSSAPMEYAYDELRPRSDGTVSPYAAEYRRISRSFIGKSGAVSSVISAVDIRLRRGTLTSLIGRSGCGKSTLLNMTAGLIQPTSGEILVNGQRIASTSDAASNRIGFVTQSETLLPWMNILDNVCLPLKIQGVRKPDRIERARAWLHRVGVEGVEDYYPSQLSGGMLKRCDVARILCTEPKLLLMDEPFASVDALTRLTLQDMMSSIFTEVPDLTGLFVTHDLGEAIALSDQVIALPHRGSGVAGVLRVEISRPRDIFRITEHPDYAALHRQLWELIAQ